MEKYPSVKDDFKYLSVVNTNSDCVTCIELIKLSPERILPLTDKRVTYGERFSDTASKLNTKDRYVVMGSGYSDNIRLIEDRWTQIPAARDLNEELNNFKEKAFYPTYIEKAEETILNGFNLSWSEFHSGMKNGVKITEPIMMDSLSGIKKFSRYDMPFEVPAFRTAMLFGGYDTKKSDMKIFRVLAPSIVNQSGSFDILGSGADLGFPVLDKYFKLLPSHKKENIELGEGLYVGLEAMINAESNIGVGGTPDIGFMEKDKEVKKFDERIARLMRNIVEKSLMGKIDDKKAKMHLTNLANDEANVLNIAKEVSSPEDVIDFLYSR